MFEPNINKVNTDKSEKEGNSEVELRDEDLDAVTGGNSAPALKNEKPRPKSTNLFEIEDFSFDIEQTLN